MIVKLIALLFAVIAVLAAWLVLWASL